MEPEKIEITQFAQDYLDRDKCKYCGGGFTVKDVCAQGNRRGDDGRSYYFYEVICPTCGHPWMATMESRPMDTKGLFAVLREMYEVQDHDDEPSPYPDGEYSPEEEEPAEESPPPPPSRITDKEVDEARKILRRSKSHDDVLKQFGATSDQLAKWRKQYEDKPGEDESK